MRYFIEFAYDGTAYHGWQIQPNGITVQQCLQTALGTLLHCGELPVVGAGRTDSGVHASFMVAHFDFPTEGLSTQGTDSLPREGRGGASSLNCPQLAYKLNKLLPPDISIYRIYPVPDDMHARFSATSRTYHYFVHTRKNPFLQKRSCFLYLPTDFDLMNEAAQILLEYEDFTSFSKTGTQTATNICHLTQAVWEPVNSPLQTLNSQFSSELCSFERQRKTLNSLPSSARLSDSEKLSPLTSHLSTPTEWRFTITANRFLRNMVRAIVGTLLQVGQGRLTIDGLRRIIEAKDRCTAGDSVAPHGLYLVDVKY